MITKLIVGLGNPGEKYANTRHNIGYMFVDKFYEELTKIPHNILGPFYIPVFENRFEGETVFLEGDYFTYFKEKFSCDNFILLKPTTGMNNSGISVCAHMKYHDLQPNDVIVIHDDLDLAAGKVKTKIGGGNAGHNGLKSIDAHIGPEYHRIRVGIGRPENGGSVLNYVLGDFEKDDQIWINEVLSNSKEYFNKCNLTF